MIPLPQRYNRPEVNPGTSGLSTKQANSAHDRQTIPFVFCYSYPPGPTYILGGSRLVEWKEAFEKGHDWGIDVVMVQYTN